MTKKDYVLIAGVLHNAGGTSVMGSSNGTVVGKEQIREVISHLRHQLGEAFAKENPRFNTTKWYEAVGF